MFIVYLEDFHKHNQWQVAQWADPQVSQPALAAKWLASDAWEPKVGWVARKMVNWTWENQISGDLVGD